MPHQLSAPRPSRAPRAAAPSLILCGTGMRLGHMTLETFRALKGCERVFCVNLPQELFLEVRREFKNAEDATASFPRGEGFSEEALCARLEAAWSGRKDAAVLFFGHPLLYSAAPELIRRCRGGRRPYKVLPGLSSIDAALAAAEGALEESGLELYGARLAVLDAPEVLRGASPLDPRSSAVFLNLFRLWGGPRGGDSAWAALVRRLKKAYGGGHPAFLVSCRADSDVCAATDVDGLRRVRLPVESSFTLIVPGRR